MQCPCSVLLCSRLMMLMIPRLRAFPIVILPSISMNVVVFLVADLLFSSGAIPPITFTFIVAISSPFFLYFRLVDFAFSKSCLLKSLPFSLSHFSLYTIPPFASVQLSVDHTVNILLAESWTVKDVMLLRPYGLSHTPLCSCRKRWSWWLGW